MSVFRSSTVRECPNRCRVLVLKEWIKKRVCIHDGRYCSAVSVKECKTAQPVGSKRKYYKAAKRKRTGADGTIAE